MRGKDDQRCAKCGRLHDLKLACPKPRKRTQASKSMAKRIEPSPPKREVGTIHKKDTMFLRLDSGSAQAEDGKRYELSVSMGNAPIIRSKHSGRWWSISWHELLTLAIEAGVDEKESNNG